MTGDVAGSCADRDANADFASALQQRVVEDAIQPDHRQQQRDGREEERQHGQQSFAYGVLLDERGLGADGADAEAGVGPRHWATPMI